MPWATVDPLVRQDLEANLGGQIVGALDQRGGFSPACAARLELSDGRRYFVKLLEVAVNAHAEALYREEARCAQVLGGLPGAERWSVPLLDTYDDRGWFGLLYPDAGEVTPPLPWRNDEVEAMLQLLGELHQVDTSTLADVLPSAWDRLGASFGGMSKLIHQRHEVLGDVPVALLERFEAWEEAAADHLVGTSLLHLDVRADNLVGTAPMRLVDWASPALGPPFVDVVLAAPCVALQGGPMPSALLERSGASTHASVDAIASVAAGFCGLLLSRGIEPEPQGLPGLRRFQLAQGTVCFNWLVELAGS